MQRRKHVNDAVILRAPQWICQTVFSVSCCELQTTAIANRSINLSVVRNHQVSQFSIITGNCWYFSRCIRIYFILLVSFAKSTFDFSIYPPSWHWKTTVCRLITFGNDSFDVPISNTIFGLLYFSSITAAGGHLSITVRVVSLVFVKSTGSRGTI